MVDEDGYLQTEALKEGLGYEYEDQVGDIDPGFTDYEYLVDNKTSNMVLSKGTELTIHFDFRDWKYLSNIISFTKRITDLDLILGATEGSINIDFSKAV